MGRRVWVLLLVLGLAIVPVRARAEENPPPPSEDYYELFKTFADTLDQVERNYVKKVDRRELVEAAIQGMISKLDPYSAYIGPDELDRFRAGVESEFGGVGIQIAIDGGQLRVLSPIAGTPAYRAGIIAGDRILEINGHSTEGITADKAMQELKGPPGTKVVVSALHPHTRKSQKITLIRDIIHVETVLGDRRLPDDNWDYLLDHNRRIGYVRLTAFSRDTGDELRKALEQLKAAKIRGLVLDLRSNPGGLLNQAIEVSKFFISDGVIVSTSGRNSPARTWNAHKEGAFEGFPMAVLVNRYSASASEIVSACLQDHHRAVIVGERTWGKGSVQNVIEMDDGHSVLKLTTASYKRPSGKNIHRFPDSKESDEWGVRPDPGYEIRLGDEELMAWMSDRRQRDVIHPHTLTAQAGEASAAKTDHTAATETKPAAASVEKSQSKGSGPAGGEKLPKKSDSKPAKPLSDQPPKQVSPPAGADEDEVEFAGPVVDRQLQKALDYLNAEIARAAVDHSAEPKRK